MTTQFFVLASVAVFLMVVDHNWRYFEKIRGWTTVAVTPVRWLAHIPSQIYLLLGDSLQKREDLERQLALLRLENLNLSRKVQKLANLTRQNAELRTLLNASSQLKERVLTAAIIGVDPNITRQQFIINQGFSAKVYQGMPFVDAYGLVGQVVFVAPFSSRVMLITDRDHKVPVEDSRNGVRAIASGLGGVNRLELLNIASTEDIRVGDILVTSGLGGAFPRGYPVGKVTKINKASSRTFARIELAPTARLSRIRFGMLIFMGSQRRVITSTLRGKAL